MVTYEEFEVICGQLQDLANKFTELNRRMNPVYLRESLEDAELSKEERETLVEKLGELRTDGALKEAEEILEIYQASVLAGALGRGISPVPAANLSPADGGEGLAENLVGRRAEVKITKSAGDTVDSVEFEIDGLEPGDGVIGDKIKVPWDGVDGYFAIGKEGWKKLQEAGGILVYEKFIDNLESWLEKTTVVLGKKDYLILENLYQSYMYILQGSWDPEELKHCLEKLAKSRGLEFVIIPQTE